MRKSYAVIALLTTLLVVTGAGCGSTTSGDKTSNTSKTTEAKTYKVGEVASAGEFDHKITEVEALATIPTSYTLPEWEIIAEELPADTGFQWVHIKGQVTNNSKQSASVDSTNVYVQDDKGNQYDVSTETTIYVDDEKSPVYISIQPTQTVDWEGYFLVPTTATGLVFVGNDLSFLPKDEVRVDLGL